MVIYRVLSLLSIPGHRNSFLACVIPQRFSEQIRAVLLRRNENATIIFYCQQNNAQFYFSVVLDEPI